MTRKFWYDMDKGGVASILKSAEVKKRLADIAEEKAAQANAMCARNYPKGATGEDYVAENVTLDWTAIAKVSAETPLAKLDRNQNHTLESLNH